MKHIIMKHLDDNMKVFVDVYEKDLYEITKLNIDSFDLVDISDEMLDNETYKRTHEERLKYFISQDEYWKSVSINKKMIEMLKRHTMIECYHIDCRADVYIVQQRLFVV